MKFFYKLFFLAAIILLILPATAFAGELVGKITTKPMPGGNGQRYFIVIKDGGKVVFTQEVTHAYGYFVSSNTLVVFKPDRHGPNNELNSYYSGKIYQYENGKMVLYLLIGQSSNQYYSYYCQADSPYKDSVRSKTIGQDFLQMLQTAKAALLQQFPEDSIEFKARLYNFYTSQSAGKVEWEEKIVKGDWASILCKQTWFDQNGNVVDGINELFVFKFISSEWQLFGVTYVGNMPMSYKEFYKNFPGLDIETAQELGFDLSPSGR